MSSRDEDYSFEVVRLLMPHASCLVSYVSCLMSLPHTPLEPIISQASKSDAAITDTTRLPISHPDHSLGAGLGPPSERDGDERQSEDDPAGAADMEVEGELPWTPKFDKVELEL